MTTSYLSLSEFPGDGVTTEWEFNFAGGYISRDHVLAYIKSDVGAITPYDITSSFISDFKVSVTPAVPVGYTLRIYRDTPREVPIVNFTGGSNFTEANLDLLARQTIFSAAEAFDAGAYAGVNDLIGDAISAAARAESEATAAALSAVAAAASAARVDLGALDTAVASSAANAVVAAAQAEKATTKAGEASASAVAASSAANAALIQAGVYTTEAVGRAAVADGVAFKVQGSGNIAAYEYRRVNAGTVSTLIATYPSKAAVDDPIRSTSGAFFYNPYYEKTTNGLYFKPAAFNGTNSFYSRGGYLDDFQVTYAAIKANLSAQSPALNSVYVEVGVTSPLGVADCIHLKEDSMLWYNPTTQKFYAGGRVKRLGELVMIHNNFDQIGSCEEESVIRSVVDKRAIDTEAWKYLCPIITSLTSPYLPNIDSATGFLTFPVGTLIQYRNTVKALPATSIDLSAISSTAKRVFYSPLTDAFTILAWSTALTEVQKTDLVLVATIRFSAETIDVAISCGYTLNNKPVGVIAIDRTTTFAAIATPLIGSTKATTYPNYATATRTFTLFADTILTSGSNNYVISTTRDIVVPNTSSANRVWWDTATNTLSTTTWAAQPTKAQKETFVLVALIRHTGILPAHISMACEYTVDGIFPSTYVAPIANPLNASVKGIHHRGYNPAGGPPEETLPAYRASAALLNSYVEGDIQWTSDGVPVILHDTTIDRTSNGTGAIASMTLATAKTYDFGSWKSAAYAGTTIPTVEEFLILCKKLNLFAFLELKAVPTAPQQTALLALLKKTGMKGRVEFDCFALSTLTAIVAEDPTQDVGFLGSLASGFITSCVSLKTGQNNVSAVVDHASVTSYLVESAHAQGLSVVCWTVNTSSDVVPLVEKGVDGIMSDSLNIASILRSSEGV